jgi:phosphate transport system substrate-binding protein
MKTYLVMATIAMILISGCDQKPKQTISISGAFALYPMAIKWSQEYRKTHPDVQIDISAGGAGKGMADCLSGTVDLGMVSRAIHPAEIERGAWAISVTKDAVVATINRNNPVFRELLAKGITRQQCTDIWITGKITTWGDLVGGHSADPVNVFTRSDACGAAETWAQYIGKKQEDLKGTAVFSDPGLAEAVAKDNFAIGYNNVNYAYDPATKKPLLFLAVAPLDVNANGKIDPEESFYDDRDALMMAIATGQYPSPPARELYLVSRGKPVTKEVVEFLRWILTEGQAYVSEAGYVNLSQETIRNELQKLKD